MNVHIERLINNKLMLTNIISIYKLKIFVNAVKFIVEKKNKNNLNITIKKSGNRHHQLLELDSGTTHTRLAALIPRRTSLSLTITFIMPA